MSLLTADQQVKSLLKKKDALERELAMVDELRHLYPDLKIRIDHGTTRYISHAVNALATKIDISPHCTCCVHSATVIWPHLILPSGVRVFSDPAFFVVGHRYEGGFGEDANSNWEEVLQASGISAEVISKVKTYIERHPPYEDREEE